MNVLFSFFILGLVFATVCASAPPELAGEPALTKLRQGYEKVMVMFYAPWCPHCQEAKPKYNDAFTKNTDKASTLAYVNCDDAKNGDFCNKEKIEGFPTIKVYQKGKDAVVFDGDMTTDGFLSFLKNPVPGAAAAPGGQQASPDTPMPGVTAFTSPEEFKKELKGTAHALVFFYAPWCPHCQEAKPKYSKAAEELNKKGDKNRRLFGVNCDLPAMQAVCNTEKVEGFPTLRYYHKGEMFAEYEEELETPDILKFINNPPKDKVPPTPIEDEKTAGKPGATPGTPDAKAGEGEKQLTDDDKKPEKPEDLMKGITYLSGPTVNDVLKTNPDTLVKFYAPWCPHCQNAKPIFVDANEKLKKAAVKAHLAAMNCDAKENEKFCEEHKIDGFPTLAYFYKGKLVKLYDESPPTAAGIVKFMTAPPRPKEEL